MKPKIIDCFRNRDAMICSKERLLRNIQFLETEGLEILAVRKCNAGGYHIWYERIR